MVKVTDKYKLKTYKDLIAWKKSYNLCVLVFKASKSFPRSELFGLTSQIKKSALSVPSNIAEGYTRQGTAEYLRFLNITYASLAELETQFLISNDLNYIKKEQLNKIISLRDEAQRILYGLIKS